MSQKTEFTPHEKPHHRHPTNLVRHAVLILGSFTILVPFLWMITTSLQSKAETYTAQSIIPTSWHWENYLQAWQNAPFARYYLNSMLMAAGIVVGHLVFDSLAAFAFARLKFPGKKVIFVVLLAALMVPSFVTIIPAYAIVAKLGWIDTFAALIVPRLADVFGIILLRQYFSTIPMELDEAARIDGCSSWQIYYRILVPLAKPALATLAIFSFLFAWNDFLWPLLVTNAEDMRTIQIGLNGFVGRYGTSWNYLMAGTLTATLPSVIVFIFFQKALERGIAATGLKD
ncbi:carbohydrate ABC transporter permease [Mobiluncus mulieris]|uniref:Carbohydrate ABC transporter permease n=1 Tax=Mobiluncus mulieris TaxID=2052 RepID=A0ABD4TYT5_9ACTO|nr:carbohydrate ABC transporter permease [Mobiluncus mulieris]MCU9968653.1 carbohydrate ABC transporter permease [Mobiluncus mulieris]MCU9973139.1 carbohydrate ABC transporter permease [Mobiluncus mulieris]MCV0008703.1 carbohydrate ABC transporter permease [Mobiluncus mulieris]NMX00652.1 carbohydrate ABC transporter permease [Mobiluncus mulieris]NMX19526.1 carbohydrate ABC transporter permease [Mobiluncus mulieris]